MSSSDEEIEGDGSAWSETLELDDDIEEFDPESTMRATDSADLGETDLRRALERLPRLYSDEEADTEPELESIGPLAVGGMAEVRLARQIPVGREVAVKRLRSVEEYSGTAGREELVQRLLREAWITGYLEHPNIVPIYRVGRNADDEPVIVMKRIEGVPWSRVIADPSRAPDNVDDHDLLSWHVEVLIEVCHAIEYAHSKGILHRDLKPANVMLGTFGEVYVVDWGIAVGADTIEENQLVPTLGDVSTRVGTPSYMAPEMLTGRAEEIDERSDIYLLGGILHEILTGDPPQRGDSLVDVIGTVGGTAEREFPSGAPDRLVDICKQALAPSPSERTSEIRLLREKLQDYLQHREATLVSQRAQERLQRLRKRLDDGSDQQLREEFAACRAQFEQALELHDGNESAREGLQSLLEMMTARALEDDRPQVAANHLADLPNRHPELEARVRRTRKRARERRKQLEDLKDYRDERDVELGREPRSLFVLAVGALTALLNLSPAMWRHWMEGQPPSTFSGITFAVYASCVAALVYRGRRRLIQNEANRSMMLSFLALLAIDGFTRTLGAWTSIPQAVTAANKAVLSGTAFVVLAITLDLRILWLAVTFLAVAPVQLALPSYPREVAAGGALVGTILLAAAWWPRDSETQE